MGLDWDKIASDLLKFARSRRGEVPRVYDVAARLFGHGCVRLQPPDQMLGARSFNCTWFDGRRQIWVDREQPESTRRFLVAREIAAIHLAATGARPSMARRDAADMLGASLLLPGDAITATIGAVGLDYPKIARVTGLGLPLVTGRATVARGDPVLVVTDMGTYTVGDPAPWPHNDVDRRRLAACVPLDAGVRILATTSTPRRIVLAAR